MCQCSAEKRTKGPFIDVTHWQPLPLHLQCSQHILSGRHTHTHTSVRTHTHSPLYLTEPNYRHLSLSDETKNCSIFRLMESDVSLSFSSSSSPPLSICCRLFAAPYCTVLHRTSPATHPLIPRLILNSLNKTQIKTDNEESFPLTATFICCDCYSESWMAARQCVRVRVILSLRPASLVVK